MELNNGQESTGNILFLGKHLAKSCYFSFDYQSSNFFYQIVRNKIK